MHPSFFGIFDYLNNVNHKESKKKLLKILQDYSYWFISEKKSKYCKR